MANFSAPRSMARYVASKSKKRLKRNSEGTPSVADRELQMFPTPLTSERNSISITGSQEVLFQPYLPHGGTSQGQSFSIQVDPPSDHLGDHLGDHPGDIPSDSSLSSETCRVPSLKQVGQQLYNYTIGSTGLQKCSSKPTSEEEVGRGEEEEEMDALRSREENIVREKLKFHFMNPFQKWKYRKKRRLPIKLVLQLMTVAMVTAQVILFGDKKTQLTKFILGNTETIKHVFLDTGSLDPDNMAVYTMEELYHQLSTGVQAFYNIRDISVAPYDYFQDSAGDPTTIYVHYEHYRQFTSDPSNEKLFFSSDTLWTIFPVYEDNNSMSCAQHHLGNCSIQAQIEQYINASNLASVKTIQLPFSLSTFYIDESETNYVSCVRLDVNVTFTNTLLKGNIPIDVVVGTHFDRCRQSSLKDQQFISAVFQQYVALDICVFLVVSVYTILCLRSIVNTFRLAHACKVFFLRFYKKKLTWRQKWDLQNHWFYGVVCGNVLVLLGIIMKTIAAFKLTLSIPLEDATTLILGLGVFFQWCGLLRFFSYFDTYNILLLTLKLSLPGVFRFAVCAGILYIAFLFCGWLVLGPYHDKFKDLSVTSECLFSLLNGDDMYTTYKEMPQTPTAIWVFSKVYLYLFISLFIYVVLSVFIGLISDTYETLNEHWYMRSKGFLHEFALGGMEGWKRRRRALRKMRPTFQEVQEVQTREGFILVNQGNGQVNEDRGDDHHDNSNSEGTDGGYRSDQGTPRLDVVDSSPFMEHLEFSTASCTRCRIEHLERDRDFVSQKAITDQELPISSRLTQSLPLLEQETDSGTVLAGNYHGNSNDDCVVDMSNLMKN